MSLRRERTLQKFTQHGLAKRSRVAARTIWSIEQGRPARQDTKRRLLRALGVPWSERELIFPKENGNV